MCEGRTPDEISRDKPPPRRPRPAARAAQTAAQSRACYGRAPPPPRPPPAPRRRSSPPARGAIAANGKVMGRRQPNERAPHVCMARRRTRRRPRWPAAACATMAKRLHTRTPFSLSPPRIVAAFALAPRCHSLAAAGTAGQRHPDGSPKHPPVRSPQPGQRSIAQPPRSAGASVRTMSPVRRCRVASVLRPTVLPSVTHAGVQQLDAWRRRQQLRALRVR